MRICLVHEEYPDETNFGGIATYQKRIAEEYVNQGHKVFVIARALKNAQRYNENGVDITRIYVEPTGDQVENYITYRKLVAEKLKELQDKDLIDIIEVPDWGAETVFFEDFRKVPLVVRLHTPLKVWLKYNKNNFGEVTNKLLAWEEKMLNCADLITCCSNILKKMIVKDFKISSRRILVTPNPANLKGFFKDESIEKQDRILYVGSLEERKGVCVLAKALNLVFEEFPKVQVDFIGKDTIRNSKNISTIDYVKNIVKKEYLDNIHFLGQKKNYELNEFYNRSRVAVFPSLFDNFPYVTLEAMATGVQIVGSKNSGMVEMLSDVCVYDTPNYKDLARLIKLKYKESFINPYNKANIKRVNRLFNSHSVCSKMIKCYERCISDYKNYFVPKTDIENVIKLCGVNADIKRIERKLGGVANAVFKVETLDEKYVVKKYNHNIDFELSKLLYEKYEKIGIKCVAPINKEPIRYNGNTFNVYNYIFGTTLKENLVEKLKDFVLVDRKVPLENRIIEKCNFFYKELLKEKADDILFETEYVLNEYKNLKDSSILKECYINHGDISKTNLIYNRKGLFVIDFDETTIAPMLYDFAVITIKFFVHRGKINFELYNNFKREIVNNMACRNEDCALIVKFYLCKILLEKFYLHANKKINLFSNQQKKDNYKKYFNLLQSFK